jgi:hypothetical protein
MSEGDDLPASFSPDGTRLLFLTSRWSKMRWSDIGVLDMGTGRVTRMTLDSQKHSGASWSPDGTRIAFSRSGDASLSSEVCVMDANGAHRRCVGRGLWKQAGTNGWVNDHQVIVSFTPADSTIASFRLLDIDRWEFTAFALPDRAHVFSDPTGRWTIIGEPGENGFVKVSPAGRFNAAVALDSLSALMMFASPHLSNTYIDSIAIDAGSSVALQVPHMLRAIAWNRNRVRMMSPVIRWRSLAPEIAEIDSLGVLMAHREGEAVIELSAGGWRTVVDTFQIRSSKAVPLLDEEWNAGAFTRWIPFGDPKPVIEKQGTSFVLNNNGDGNYFSGLYFGKSLDTSRGIALDVDLSTPITVNQWQMIQVSLGELKRRSYSEWDHKTGYLTLGSEANCVYAYPSGEGEGATRRYSWYESMKAVFKDPSFRLDDGRWYRLRVQLLPDGRCGIAINGRAMTISAPASLRLFQVTPVIQGSNVGSRILVGRLRLFEGVPDDVDWSILQSNDRFEWLRPLEHHNH